MKLKIILFSTLILLFLSCKNNDTKRILEQQKDLKKKTLVFENINKSWIFNIPELQPQSQILIANWTEWRLFLEELRQKPKSSIGAFKKKSKKLTQKTSDLTNTLPQQINISAIKSRIAVLNTQIRMLDLYMNLQNIPDQKVALLIPEINAAILSFSQQLEEIIRKNTIPMEKGESDMLKMLDTSRAIPNNSKI